MTFNEHYELLANGLIRYNGFEDQLVSDLCDVKVKIENNRNPFSIRFHKWNRSYIFDVYLTGMFLHDPILRSLQYNDRIDNVIAERNEVANENQGVEREHVEIENESRENVAGIENNDRQHEKIENRIESQDVDEREQHETESNEREAHADHLHAVNENESRENDAQQLVESGSEHEQLEAEKTESEGDSDEKWEDVREADPNFVNKDEDDSDDERDQIPNKN